MYEFLAPWGILAPAISAAIVYWVISEKRRQNMMVTLDAPKDTNPLSYRSVPSGLV